MKRIVASVMLLCAIVLLAQSQNKQILPLWPNGAKESNGITTPEKTENQHRIINISEASITVQLPAASKATGAAVVICPGGGYIAEAAFHEGYQFADWLNEHGIAGIVLKYRLPNGHSDIPLTDAKRAMRLVRAHTNEWNIDPKKIAIAGFSAGGHLASTLGTHFDDGDAKASDAVERFSSRPDLMLLFYPVVSMKKNVTHAGSRSNLLGQNPPSELEDLYSNELQVKANTPPTILFLSDDDGAVPPVNSIQFYNALKEKKIPSSMAIFPTGGHGWGMRTNVSFWQIWREMLADWFVKYQFVKQ
ncbi:alpha/beta hydrolase [Paludibacter jiangxiensis]|uniref:Acetyl esterase n=1 Tax=Paludibacter jiangxiensis TaxID=681398 RepID=A0A161LSG5_9BACT|nr:alpha/beta hydrolase [Paludibacter jiangxiensis]GAT63690.1 acetyl esterase [Paludibacter jiangxiensis]